MPNPNLLWLTWSCLSQRGIQASKHTWVVNISFCNGVWQRGWKQADKVMNTIIRLNETTPTQTIPLQYIFRNFCFSCMVVMHLPFTWTITGHDGSRCVCQICDTTQSHHRLPLFGCSGRTQTNPKLRTDTINLFFINLKAIIPVTPPLGSLIHC